MIDGDEWEGAARWQAIYWTVAITLWVAFGVYLIATGRM